MTSSDMIRKIATAVTAGDEMTLDDCEQIVHDWMMNEDEREAFLLLIDAARESILFAPATEEAS